VPTAQGEKVIMVEPEASVRGEVRHTVTGRMEGIARDAGQITVKTTNGSKTMLSLTPVAPATIRAGTTSRASSWCGPGPKGLACG
jgi:hypothetical protein